MNTIIIIFTILQIILLLFMVLHDWIHIPPFTDIRELEKHNSTHGRIINSAIFATIVSIPLILTIFYRDSYPLWTRITILFLYGLLSLGAIVAWWVPYFIGSSQEHKDHFIEYRNTHHFLPARGNNVVPNTLHVLLHLQIWICFALSFYLLIVY